MFSTDRGLGGEALAHLLGKVLISDGCWEWVGWKSGDGYGTLVVDGVRTSAHRRMWALVNGPIPGDLFILHSCDNPACVNPEHLSLGTQSDNMRDAARKGRIPTPINPKAHAKLDAGAVERIRAAHARGSTTEELGRLYGVHRTTISDIVNNHSWLKPVSPLASDKGSSLGEIRPHASEVQSSHLDLTPSRGIKQGSGEVRR